MINRRTSVKAGLIFLASLTGRTNAMAQSATPKASDSPFAHLLHNDLPDFPSATEGTVEVVLMAHANGNYAAAVFHNATEDTVGVVDIVGIAREAEGSLYAVSEHSIHAPYVLKPGEYGIAMVPFDKELVAGSEITFSIPLEDLGKSIISIIDLPVTEVAIDQDSVVGLVENTTDEEATVLVAIVGLFFDEDGAICGWFRTYLNNNVAPGGIGTFASSGLEGVTSESYAFAASGWAG